jgi:hypothetical protein
MKMLKAIVCSSVISSLVTLAIIGVLQPRYATAAPAAQEFDVIQVRGIEVVDQEGKRVVTIGSDLMNGISGIWIGGPPRESQQIELLVSSLPGPSGSRPVGILVRDDIRSVMNTPAVRGGHGGGPILWQAP